MEYLYYGHSLNLIKKRELANIEENNKKNTNISTNSNTNTNTNTNNSNDISNVVIDRVEYVKSIKYNM